MLPEGAGSGSARETHSTPAARKRKKYNIESSEEEDSKDGM